jgi:prevent-host-death family protein
MQVNVHDARTQLSRLLELVDQGESVTIARHGKPVVELVPSAVLDSPWGSQLMIRWCFQGMHGGSP